MRAKGSRFAAVLASVAACSMIASPALAQGWGGWGGWGGWDNHRRHHDRVDAGDVLTGILILGGIAVLVDAASKNKRGNRNDGRDERRNYPQRSDDNSQREQNGGYANDNRPEWNQAGGIDAAVSTCTSEVARGSARVDGVDSVNRAGDGWRVQGRTSSGGNFTCTVDGAGRIRNVNVDGRSY